MKCSPTDSNKLFWRLICNINYLLAESARLLLRIVYNVLTLQVSDILPLYRMSLMSWCQHGVHGLTTIANDLQDDLTRWQNWNLEFFNQLWVLFKWVLNDSNREVTVTGLSTYAMKGYTTITIYSVPVSIVWSYR